MILKKIAGIILLLLVLVSCGNSSDNEKKKVDPPQFLKYGETELILEKNIPLDFMFPEYVGDEIKFYSRPLLPRGLVLNPSNGTLSGIPKEVTPETEYTIYAENDSGNVSFNIKITINERPIPSISYSQSKYTYTIGESIPPIEINTIGANFVSFDTLKDLPSGILIDSETGTISGTPSQLILNYTTTVEALTDEDNSVFTTISFDIKDIPPENLFYPTTNLVLKRDTEMDSVFPSSSGGNVISYSVAPQLPNGLNFNTMTGEISGTPLSVRIPSNFVITATNSGGSTTTVVSIEVQDLPPQGLSYGSNSFIFTKSIELNPIYPSTAGGGIPTSYSINPQLPNGLNFNTVTGEISGTPLLKQDNQTYTITAMNSGGTTSTQLSIFVKDLPPQNLSYNIVSNIYVKNTAILPLLPNSNGGDILAYSINPELPNGLNFNTVTGEISGTPLVQAEAQSYTVTASNNQGSSQYSFFIAIKDEAPRNLIYSQEDLILTKGDLIPELSPSNEGGLITSYTSSPLLPSGLVLNKTTGIISGTPNQVIPRTNFIITGSNATGETTRTIHLKINDIAPENLSYGISSYTFDRGIAIPNLLSTNDGGLITNYSISPDLPIGLEINNLTGEISGTPNTFIEETEFIITGVNTGGSTSVSLFITINDYPPQDLFYGELPYKLQKNISLGSEGLMPVYSGGEIVNFTISPDLPQGLYIEQSTGAIKGTPTEKTSEFIVYTVTGENTGGSTSSTITINVTDEPPIVTFNDSNYSYTRLDSVNIIPNVSGGNVTQWTITPNNLPSGLTFNTNDGSITGTVQEKFSLTDYSIKASNDGGSSINEISMVVYSIAPNNLSYPNTSYVFPKEIRSDPNDPSTSNYSEPLALYGTIYGDPVDTWTITPDLPEGLTFNVLGESVISGIPLEGTGTITYTVTATNDGGTTSFTFDMRIRDEPPINLEYVPNTYAFDTADDIFIASPFNEGGTIKTYSISPSLPNGLEFNTTNGEIVKISTVIGQPSTTYTIVGSNDEGSTSTTLTISLVDSPPTNLLYGEGSPFGDAVTFFTFGEAGSFFPVNDGGGIENYEDIQYYRIDKGPDYLNNREDTIKVEINTVPQGLQFNSSTGELHGTIVKNSTSDNKFYGLDVKGTNDGGITFTYTLIYFNDKPIPNAGIDIEGTINESVTLMGTNTDIDDNDDEWPFEDTDIGRQQNFEWFIKSKPLTSNLTNNDITNRLTANPSFIPDAIGVFVLELQTNDGLVNSDFRDEVTVTVVDVPPSNLTYGSSIHGFDKFLFNIGDSVNLTPSSDGGDVVEYSINKPLPSGLNFNSLTGKISGTISTSFNPDEFIITASNTGGSTNKTIHLWGNNVPIANIATGGSKLEFGNILTLDGSSSIDSDFNYSQIPPFNSVVVEKTYSWRVISKPAGSNLSSNDFSDSNGEITTIIPDAKGSYSFGLIVNDGFVNSIEKVVTITTAISPKNINYGNIGYSNNNFVYNENESINLTPTFEGDSSYFTISPSLPSGLNMNSSTGKISGSSSSYSPLTSYTVTATNNGGSSSVNIILWINNESSISYNSLIENIIVGNEFTLNSLSINDIDKNNILNPPFNSLSNTFTWKLIGKPSESSLSINDFSNKNSTNIKFTPDVEGVYIINLHYNDGLIDSINEARIIIKTSNISSDQKPIAKQTSPILEEVLLNDVVSLDMSTSETYKGVSNYSWSILSKPLLSNAVIVDDNLSIASLEIDEEGLYIIKGVVDDGTDSDSLIKYIYTSNSGTIFNGGQLNLNETLTLENSPYFLDSDLDIVNGATLTLEDGVVLIGGSNELRVSNGKIFSSSLSIPILISDIKINSGDSANTDFEFNNNILIDSSFCEINYNLSSECRGRFVLKQSDIINSKIVDSVIGNSIKEMSIEENIFVNSHGIELLTISNNINVLNNYIYNPQGGRLNIDPYFLIITQNDIDAIKVNNNYFADENTNQYKYLRVNNIINNNVDFINNNWFNYQNESDFEDWILNINKSVVIPFATDSSIKTRNGKKYITN
jgi:hypothetical protein